VNDVPWPAVSLLCSLLVGLYTWIATGQRVHHEQLETLRRDVEKRLATVEHEQAKQTEQLRHLPTAEQLNALVVTIAELRADVRSLTTQVTALSARLDRIEDFMSRQT